VEVPVYAHPLAEAGKGTGLVMVCTFGDLTDVTWWRDLQLDTRVVVGRDGRMLPEAPSGVDATAYAELAGRPPEDIQRLYDLPEENGLFSNFTPDEYRAAVERVIAYIHAGEVFQVNLAQRLLLPARESAFEMYCRLREQSPAPFAGFFDLGDTQICSASPERFLCVRDNVVETRPIKGTRRRAAEPAGDRRAAEELLRSAKDRAENVMIVDLMRNDLSRTCRPESVHVSQLCGLESYASVHHLVSEVEGALREDQTPLTLLQTCLPGGYVTGAPTLRAMEIIS
jgi:para-aminobenzoate synthetase component 1